MSQQPHTASGTLGIERWVQFTYIAAAVMGLWFFDHAITAAWARLGEPDPAIVQAASAILALVVTVGMYKSPQVHRFSNECAVELAKVTWPSRKETWSQTVVVLLVSALAAVIIGAFDAIWSTVTDLIYKV